MMVRAMRHRHAIATDHPPASTSPATNKQNAQQQHKGVMPHALTMTGDKWLLEADSPNWLRVSSKKSLLQKSSSAASQQLKQQEEGEEARGEGVPPSGSARRVVACHHALTLDKNAASLSAALLVEALCLAPSEL